MNFAYMPELEHPWGYPMALASMIAVCGCDAPLLQEERLDMRAFRERRQVRQTGERCCPGWGGRRRRLAAIKRTCDTAEEPLHPGIPGCGVQQSSIGKNEARWFLVRLLTGTERARRATSSVPARRTPDEMVAGHRPGGSVVPFREDGSFPAGRGMAYHARWLSSRWPET